MWTLAGQKFKLTLSGHSNWVRSVKFNPQGNLVVSGGKGEHQVCPVVTRVQAMTKPFDSGMCRSGTVSRRSTITLGIDFLSLTSLLTIDPSAVNDVAFHPDGLCVVACSADHTINIWDIRMNQCVDSF